MGEIFNIENLPQGWTLTSIDKIAEIVMGQSPPSDTYNNEGIGLPFFQGKAEFTELHPIVRKWCRKPNKIALPGDILISVRAPVGATNISNVECCIGRGLAAIRYTPCNKFLFYYLRLIEKKLDEKGTGTTFRAISGDVIRETPVYLPPQEEQHRIVAKIEELFSNLDKGIERLKAARQQLKIYRQAVLKWAFEGRLNESDKMKVELRKDRKYKILSELYHSVTSGSRGWAKYYSDSGAIFIRMGNLDHDTIQLDLSSIQYVKLPDVTEGMRTLVLEDDILISITADVGMIAIIPDGFPEAYINQHVALVRPNTELVIPKYLAWFLASAENGQKQMRYFKRGATKVGLSLDDIKALKIPIPSLKEQQDIVLEIEQRLSVCNKLEESIHQGLEQAEALRQSILKKAFYGKLVTQEPNNDSADHPLEQNTLEKIVL